MTALTTQSIILTKIVHRTRDCMRITARVQHIDGPLGSNIGGPNPCDPAALTPVLPGCTPWIRFNGFGAYAIDNKNNRIDASTSSDRAICSFTE